MWLVMAIGVDKRLQELPILRLLRSATSSDSMLFRTMRAIPLAFAVCALPA